MDPFFYICGLLLFIGAMLWILGMRMQDPIPANNLAFRARSICIICEDKCWVDELDENHCCKDCRD
jgi:hypothetical protein